VLHTLKCIVVQVPRDGTSRTHRASRFQRTASAHFRLPAIKQCAISQMIPAPLDGHVRQNALRGLGAIRVACIGDHIDRLRRPAYRCLRGFRHRLKTGRGSGGGGPPASLIVIAKRYDYS
jgi:hypothetical protein